jgi:hypothetical protein
VRSKINALDDNGRDAFITEALRMYDNSATVPTSPAEEALLAQVSPGSHTSFSCPLTLEEAGTSTWQSAILSVSTRSGIKESISKYHLQASAYKTFN